LIYPKFPKPNQLSKLNGKSQRNRLKRECDRIANLIVKTRDNRTCQRCGKQ